MKNITKMDFREAEYGFFLCLDFQVISFFECVCLNRHHDGQTLKAVINNQNIVTISSQWQNVVKNIAKLEIFLSVWDWDRLISVWTNVLEHS